MVLRACSRLPRLSSARSVLGGGALPPKPTQLRKNNPFFNQGNVNAGSKAFSRGFYHLGQVLSRAHGAQGAAPPDPNRVRSGTTLLPTALLAQIWGFWGAEQEAVPENPRYAGPAGG